MAKTEPKTRPTEASVKDFLDSIKDEQQREDSKVILKMMQKATGDKPVMWGSSIVGFGSVPLKYASGRELEWPKIGFSPRKQNIALYVLGSNNEHTPLLSKLGKYKTGVVCLYIKKLSDIDLEVLEDIIEEAVEQSDVNRRS